MWKNVSCSQSSQFVQKQTKPLISSSILKALLIIQMNKLQTFPLFCIFLWSIFFQIKIYSFFSNFFLYYFWLLNHAYTGILGWKGALMVRNIWSFRTGLRITFHGGSQTSVTPGPQDLILCSHPHGYQAPMHAQTYVEACTHTCKNSCFFFCLLSVAIKGMPYHPQTEK